VNEELDQILILPSHDDYNQKLEKLREKKTPAGRFSGRDSETDDVRNILRDVAEEGRFKDTNDAVAYYTKKHDGVDLKPEEFRVSKEDLKKAHDEIDIELLESICQAIENVRKYQTEIFIGNKNTHPGIKYTPIKRVGICVPGASAPLPSTVIMTAVPAQVAGVKTIVIVSPPRWNGSIHPVTLAVCYELEIDEVYRIGGAQAVASLASNKGTVPQVDKIVGPGNKWVQTAKKMVLTR
jgi:histidinol dehydrogenase